jgi:formylglycine-generating enzyme required for sulfatase activity
VGWPRAGDYDAAIQSPSCFGDEELARCRPVESAILPGQLLSYSGNFACVFKLAGPGGQAWAVKCFTRPVTDQQERYRAISEHLAGNPRKFAVDFRYLAEGVRIGGAWFPVLKMRWVEGAHLNELLAEHAGNASLLRQMSGLWLRLAAELREARMAHGDIQHGNVLLVPAAQAGKVAVRLVDYDGMWVPPLNGKPPGEVGHPNYQHPARLKQGGYFSEIDRFAHLVVYTTLQCLRSGGKGLWARHDTGENLLFLRADFDNPASSKLLPDLLELPDPHARSLVGHLIDAARGPLYRVPLLSELVDGDAVAPLSGEQVERLKGLVPQARWERPAPPSSPVRAAVAVSASAAAMPGGASAPVPVEGAEAFQFGPPNRPGLRARHGRGVKWYWLVALFAAVGLPLGLWLAWPSSRRPPAAAPPDEGEKPRPSLRLVVPSMARLEQGKKATFEVRLERRGHDGPVVLRLLDLPKGAVAGEEVTVPGDRSLATMEVEQPPRLRPPLGLIHLVRVVALVDGEQVAQQSLTLRVEKPAAVGPGDLPLREVTNSIGMRLVLVPAGKFKMGSPEEGPVHEVEITKAFRLGVFEVTQEEYRKVVGSNPSHFCSTGVGKDVVQGLDTSTFPVENVSWEDAVAFCKKLSELPEEMQAGRVYRLPTEAEWEYACRAGTTTAFHFGEALSSTLANFDGRFPFGGAPKGGSPERPSAVGSYAKNAFGLADMHGNVWEWCSDWYGDNYYGVSPAADPPGPAVGTARVLRGGGWSNEARSCQSAFRGKGAPTLRLKNLGFRVALVPAGR